MKMTVGGLGSSYHGPPDIVDTHIHTTKEAPTMKMNKKQKTVLLRFVRTLAATAIGFTAAWLAGPEVTALVDDPTIQSLILVVVVPTLVAANKALRYGSDDGESGEG